MIEDAPSAEGGAGPAPGPPRDDDMRRAARRLLRTARSAAIATLAAEAGPYASLVSLATLPDGSPVLPLSTLAVHTRHLLADARCSLLLARPGTGDPLVHPRLTLVGRAVETDGGERAASRARFLRRHPDAALYVDFADFSFWRVEITGGRLIGGFGRVAMLSPADLLTDLGGAEALLAGEAGAVDHMNADHADAVRLYATALAGAADGEWRMAGLDPDGVDLVCADETLRLDFPARVTDPAALRRELARWAERARGSR